MNKLHTFLAEERLMTLKDCNTDVRFLAQQIMDEYRKGWCDWLDEGEESLESYAYNKAHELVNEYDEVSRDLDARSNFNNELELFESTLETNPDDAQYHLNQMYYWKGRISENDLYGCELPRIDLEPLQKMVDLVKRIKDK